MRLASLIILDHFLIETPSILNFGGPFRYEFELKKSKIELFRFEQTHDIPNFFGERITNLSAIVGANGTGKTSIMRVLNIRNDDTKAIFIYEDEGAEIKIVNRTGSVNEHGNFTEKSQLKVLLDKKELSGTIHIDIPSLYYSPIVDFDLVNVESPISQTKHFNHGLEDFHLDSVERNVLFMSDKIIEDLKTVYPDLPSYDKLNIRPKPHYKRDLRKRYGGFKEKGDVESAQEKLLDELWETYEISTKDKEQYIHDSTVFFRDLEINIFSYLIIDGTAMETAFNGGFEMSVKDIHSEPTFELKLMHTFFRKISHIDKYISQELKAAFKGDYHMLLFAFEESNFDHEIKRKEEAVINIIETAAPAFQSSNLKKAIERFQKLIGDIGRELIGTEFQGIHNNLNKFSENPNLLSQKDSVQSLSRIKKFFETLRENIPKSFEHIYASRFEIIDQIKDAAKRSIRLFDGIQKLHLALEETQSKYGVKITDGILTLNLAHIDYDDFELIIKRYRAVLSEFHSNSVIGRVQLLEFYPNKRLSFGEKSLLSFFGSLYEFTLNKYYHERRKKNYLLLLDETDLGYHPLWKKKFISALVKVLPILFSRLEYDSEEVSGKKEVKRNPNIQIIVSTHDPLTLSDIPNNHITYLNKVSDKTTILNQKNKPKLSFGANITELLADSFFVGDGLVGDFVKDKIDKTIDWLIDQDAFENSEYHKNIIQIIDEPIIKQKLSEMYSEKMKVDFSRDILREQMIVSNKNLKIRPATIMIYYDLASKPKIISTHFNSLKKDYLIENIRTSTINKRLKDFITNNLYEIITGSPENIQKLNNKFKRHKSYSDSKILKGKIRTIFNYEKFRDKSVTLYDAYDLANNLGVRTCLYCNRMYTITVAKGVKTDEKITRPQFDHFFDKAKNPLLALSIFNLIPSCNICNSTLKGTKEFALHSYMHPYIDNYINQYSYKFIPHDVSSILGQKSNLDVKISIKTGILKDLGKIKKTSELFKLSDIMSGHSEELKDMFDIRYKFSQRYFKELFTTYKKLGLTYEEVYRIVFGVHFIEDKFNQRPFSKLKKDILKELGIL